MHSAQPGQLAGTAPSMLQNLTLPFRGLLAGQYVKGLSSDATLSVFDFFFPGLFFSSSEQGTVIH